MSDNILKAYITKISSIETEDIHGKIVSSSMAVKLQTASQHVFVEHKGL